MKVKRKAGKVLSIVLSVALLLGLLPTDTWGGISEVKAETTEHVLDMQSVAQQSTDTKGTATPLNSNTASDGSSVKVKDFYPDEYFTMMFSETSSLIKNENFSISIDGTDFSAGFVLGGGSNFTKNSNQGRRFIKFTTSSTAKVEVWWLSGSTDTRTLQVVTRNDNNEAVNVDSANADNNGAHSTFSLSEGNTYYLYSAANITICKVVVTEGLEGSDDSGEGDESEIPTEWNFRSGSSLMGSTNGVVINTGNTGKVSGLEIDATTGKFDSTRSDWAQVNTGTIIKVPVSGKSVVKVVGYNKGAYKVDGEESDADAQTEDTFICEGTDNVVTIEFISNSYLGSIVVSEYTDNGSENEDNGNSAATIAEGTYNFYNYADINAVKEIEGLSLTDSVKFKDSQHGLTTNGGSITLNLKQAANITITQCYYGSVTVTSTSGSVSALSSDYDPVCTVYGAAPEGGEVTLTFTSGKSTYIHSINVEYVDEVTVMHDVTVNVEGGVGTAKASASVAEAGTEITLTESASVGYTFKEWKVVSGNVTIADNKFTVGSDDVEITAVFAEVPKEWNFRSGSSLMDATNGVIIEGTTGEFEGLQIDATYVENNTKGKFNVKRTDWAQVNKGTIIKVPVFGKSEVTVVGYDKGVYTVDGQESTAAAQAEDTFICDGTDNVVTIEFTSTSYLGLIKVTPILPEGTINFASVSSTERWWGMTLTDVAGADNSHGLNSKEEGSIVLNLSDNANIVVMGCRYGKGTITYSSGTVSVEEVDESGDNAQKFTILNAKKGEVTLSLKADNESGMWLHSIAIEYIKAQDDKEVDTTKKAVWDLGAEPLDTETYINMLTAEDLNNAIGTASFSNSFTINEDDTEKYFEFFSNSKNCRLYATTAYGLSSDKLYGENANWSSLGTGALYVNGQSADPYVAIYAKAGDIVEVWAGGNNGESTIVFETTGVEKQQAVVAKSGGKVTFYAPVAGKYKIYSANEKLVLSRIIREHVDKAAVSGTVSFGEGTDSLKGNLTLIFTNDKTNAETEVAVAEDGTYNVTLPQQYSYSLSLKDANGYVIESGASLELAKGDATKTHAVAVVKVPLKHISGKITGVDAADISNLALTFTSDNTYKPEVTISADNATYEADLENGAEYVLEVSGINDYQFTSDMKTDVKITEDTVLDVTFEKKPTYKVTISPVGPTVEDLNDAEFTFENLTETGYSYSFTGTDSIALRDGTYSVTVTNVTGWEQKLSPEVKVNGEAVTATVNFNSTAAVEKGEYKEVITVGASGCDYTTINDALDAIRNMDRTSDQKVTVQIQPGNYEEMLVIDVSNIKLVNASSTPSLELKNKGVDIDDNAVRITSYYGHGYSYYSMGEDCKWSEEVLEISKQNGHVTKVNPGSGTTDGSYWNATVVINASNVEAEGIIFENSFNQYVSKKAAEDIIVKDSGAKEGTVARADMEYGDTTVQDKAYVERAAALAIYNNCKQISFDNCKFVGRQDTLYGGTGVTAAFYDCSVYGGTDYIFGAMTAVFAKCDLVFNTSDSSNDVGHITAAQQSSGRGYLMYNCHVTSTTPGVDTASTYTSKAGTFGRPWAKNTAEVIYYKTVVDATDNHWYNDSPSLIQAAGWNSGLSGTSDNVAEYDTYEMALNVDNSANRASWAKVLTEEKLPDGNPLTVATFLGSWDAFAGKDMTIVMPTDKVDNSVAEEPSETPDTDPSEEPSETPDTDPSEEPTETPDTEPSEEPIETPELPVVIPSPVTPVVPNDGLTVKKDDTNSIVSAVTTVGTVAFKDAQGNEVKGDVTLKTDKLDKAPTTAIENKVAELIKDNKDEAKVLYYDITAYAGDDVVTLAGGKVKVKMPYPEGANSSNQIIALHNADSVPVEKDSDGFWITADGFSPYTVVILPGDTKAGDDDDDDDDDTVVATVVAALSPKTGDSTRVLLSSVMALVAMAGIVVINRRKKEEK